jgi:uncharacterized phage protein (TIGR01671 family)
MKKDIKFRAWDKENNAWCNHYTNSDCMKFLHNENLIVEQFTGLNDKSNNNIFEGDIIKASDNKLMIVGWSIKFASFTLDRKGWAFVHWFGESCNSDECVIVGNIHENNDLL